LLSHSEESEAKASIHSLEDAVISFLVIILVSMESLASHGLKKVLNKSSIISRVLELGLRYPIDVPINSYIGLFECFDV